MRIGYCTYKDPHDKHSWSGTHYYIMKALTKHCGEVVPLGPLKTRYVFFGKLFKKISNIFLKKNFSYMHATWISKRLATLITNKIANKYTDLDVLFFPAGSEIISYLDTTIPIVYLSDATFKLVSDYYPEYSNMLSFSKKMGNKIEKKAIDKSTRIIYASDWTARSAINDYSCDEKKIKVIPFGANIEDIPSKDEMYAKRKDPSSTLKLLFIGVDWIRKGGQIAFDTFIELNNMGIDTELYIVGCTPPSHFRHEKMHLLGFLNKNNPENALKLKSLFLDASFLMFPTRNECAGIVSCEANAFGLPVISTNTGGVATYVNDNENGYLLDYNATAAEYAKVIARTWKDKTAYISLCTSSIKKYHNDLNWDVWGKKVNLILKEITQKK